ncbi:MAG: M16 family metallopeptidase [Planctomycetota bacterium]
MRSLILLTSCICVLQAQSVQRRVLDSGITLIVRDRQVSHVVDIQVLVRAAPLHEEGLLGTGVSDLLRRLAMAGGRDIGERLLHGVGDRLRGQTHVDHTAFGLTTTDSQFASGLDVLAGLLTYRDYTQEDLERQRQRMLARTASPGLRAEERRLLDMAVYRRHPARLPVTGVARLTRTLQLAQIRAYQAARYTAPNVTVIVVGHVSANAIEAEVERAFTALPSGGWHPKPRLQEPPQYAAQVTARSWSRPEERRVFAWRLPHAGHEDQPALEVLAALLDSPRHSPLRQALESGQLATDLWVRNVKRGAFPGYIAISYQPLPKRGADAWLAVQQVLRALINGGPGNAGLQAAKQGLRRSAVARQATARDIGEELASWEVALGVPTYGERFQNAIAAVGSDELRLAAARWLCDDSLNRLVLSSGTSESATAIDNGPTTLLSDVPPTTTALSNGVRVLHQYSPVGLVHLCATLGGGRAVEAPEHRGAATVLARLFTRGTLGLNGQDFQDRLAALGMSLDVERTTHAITLTMTCFPEHQTEALAILVDILKRPDLQSEAIDRIRQQVLAELAKRERVGGWRERLVAAVRDLMFADHYASAGPLGTRATLQAVKSDVVAALHQRLTVPANVVIGFYGDSDATAALTELERLMSGAPALPDGKAPRSEGADWSDGERPSGTATLAWDGPQRAIALAWPGIAREDLHAWRATFDVLCTLLAGDGDGRRLARRLGSRARKVDYDREYYAGRGLLVISAELADGVGAETVQAALTDEIATLRSQLSASADAPAEGGVIPLPADELVAAKTACITRHTLALERPREAARAHAGILLRDGDLKALTAYAERVQAVTVEDLATLAASCFDSPPVVVVLESSPESSPENGPTAQNPGGTPPGP